MRIIKILFAIGFFCLTAGGAPLRVSLPPLTGAVPVVMGAAWGLFEEEGITVELVPLPSQRDRILAFQAGQIDAMVTDLTGALILMGAGGNDAVIAGTLYTPDPTRPHVFVITPPAYSRISSWGDLLAKVQRGERVQLAVPRQSDLEFVLDELFRKEGVTFRAEGYIGQDNLISNASWVLFGMVTAGALPQPYVDYILNFDFPGKPQLVVIAEVGAEDVPPEVLVIRRAITQREPAKVAAFFRALRRAVDRLNASTREELVALALPQAVNLFFPGANPEEATPEDRARIEAAIAAISIPVFPQPGPVDPQMYERVVSWAARKGYIRSPIPYAIATTTPPE